MEVFIHEDYVNKRNEVRREQRRRRLQMLRVEGNPDASRQALLAGQESPRATPTASPSSVRSPTPSALQSPAAAAAGEAGGGWPSEHRRLYDCLKPY